MTVVVEFYIPDKYRKHSVKLLEKHFDKQYCQLIEQGIFDFTEQYCKNNGNHLVMAKAIYKDTSQNIIFNLEQNCKTIQKIKKLTYKQKYNIYNLAFLRPDELNEDNWMKILLRKNTTEDKLNNLPTIKWQSCHRCKKTRYFYYQLQTRSADEPMTTFYICKNCNKTYKVNN